MLYGPALANPTESALANHRQLTDSTKIKKVITTFPDFLKLDFAHIRSRRNDGRKN